jgi:Flp pilus assembly secretin CpaC
MSLDIVLPDVPAPTPTAIDISPTTEPTFAIDTLAIDAPRPAIAPAYTAEQLASAIRVELESQSAREFEVDTPIQSIMVVDETVCRTVARDGRMYLVGIQTGETMIEVQPTDGSPSRWVLAKVVSPWQRSQGPVDLDQLTHAIQPLSPDGLLNIRAQEDGSIVVRGKVDSKETAKRIMELTRKMILVPVVDKLEIR